MKKIDGCIIPLILLIFLFLVNKSVFAQSCGSISCPSGYYLSYRCCDAGSCSANNNDGNPQTGCDGLSSSCSSSPSGPYQCCECTPISGGGHPCGSCIPSSCGGGRVSKPQENLFAYEVKDTKQVKNIKFDGFSFLKLLLSNIKSYFQIKGI
jgi:hypothetical protein